MKKWPILKSLAGDLREKYKTCAIDVWHVGVEFHTGSESEKKLTKVIDPSLQPYPEVAKSGYFR